MAETENEEGNGRKGVETAENVRKQLQILTMHSIASYGRNATMALQLQFIVVRQSVIQTNDTHIAQSKNNTFPLIDHKAMYNV